MDDRASTEGSRNDGQLPLSRHRRNGATFEPGKTIVVRRVGVTDPISYVLGKTVQYVDRAGKTIEASMIKPGAKVNVYYDKSDDTQVVNRVIVDQ